MSKRPEITADLSAVAERYIDPHNDPRIYWAREVTFDYAMGYASRVDYMLFKLTTSSPYLEHIFS